MIIERGNQSSVKVKDVIEARRAYKLLNAMVNDEELVDSADYFRGVFHGTVGMSRRGLEINGERVKEGDDRLRKVRDVYDEIGTGLVGGQNDRWREIGNKYEEEGVPRTYIHHLRALFAKRHQEDREVSYASVVAASELVKFVGEDHGLHRNVLDWGGTIGLGNFWDNGNIDRFLFAQGSPEIKKEVGTFLKSHFDLIDNIYMASGGVMFGGFAGHLVGNFELFAFGGFVVGPLGASCYRLQRAVRERNVLERV